jgi:hypothetical protein
MRFAFHAIFLVTAATLHAACGDLDVNGTRSGDPSATDDDAGAIAADAGGSDVAVPPAPIADAAAPPKVADAAAPPSVADASPPPPPPPPPPPGDDAGDERGGKGH